MAAYKDLVGQKITKVTSNPGEPKTGQMWYNSTSGSLKGLSVVKAFTSSSTYLAELFSKVEVGNPNPNAHIRPEDIIFSWPFIQRSQYIWPLLERRYY